MEASIDNQELLQSIMEDIAPWGIRVVGVLAALLVAWLVAGWAKRRMLASLERREFDATLSRFFANITRYGILLGALLGCLGVFGIETTSFAAVIGAAGLAVGLAFQGTLSNFAAGAMLLVFRPFKVGDYVKVAGIAGTVEEIELFTTTFRTPDARILIVPNGAIYGSIIENVNALPERRVDVDVGTDYGADLEEVRKVLEACAADVEGGLEEPAPQVFLKGLGASSIDWVVRVWVKTPDYWDVHQRATHDVKAALDAAKIGIPFPQMDVHLDRTDQPGK